MDKEQDPYGRFDLPKEEVKSYFSPLMPIRVLIYFYFFLLRDIFVERWQSIAQEQTEQVKKPSYDQDGFVTFVLVVALLLEISLVFGGLALCSHLLAPILCINGYLLFASAVTFILITFFAFHLHTEEGFEYWKNKLLG